MISDCNWVLGRKTRKDFVVEVALTMALIAFML